MSNNEVQQEANLSKILSEAESRYLGLRSSGNRRFSYRCFRFAKGVAMVDTVSPVLHLLTVFTDDGVTLGCVSVHINDSVAAPASLYEQPAKPQKQKSSKK